MSDDQEIDPIAREVLREIPEGQDNARPVSEIATQVSVSDPDATRYKVRRIIKDLITEHNQPIGSCSDGYFRIETQQELDDYIEDLRGRIEGIEQRIHALRNAFILKMNTVDNGGQAALFDGPDNGPDRPHYDHNQ